jgi:transposase
MSYIVKQKIGKNIYAYEAVSYYDKKKKQPRQKRTYLGRVDPETNEIVKTDRMKASIPKSAKSFGLVHLLDHVGESIGLKKALFETFPNEWKNMLSLSFFELSEGKPLYLFPQWLEDTYIPYLNKRGNISSQSISKLLKDIGERDAKREQFFINWISKVEDTSSVIFDITSISSYSNRIDTVEWGYNRDKENLPQINLGMVFGEPSSLPLFYSLYQGSIPDIVTLKNILLRLNSFGIKDTLFVMDRGFFSRHNIDMMCEDNIKFIMPMSFTTKLSKEFLLKHREDLSSPLNFFMHNGNIIFSVEEPIEIDKHKLYAFIYLDKQREAEETQRFLKGLASIEREVQYHSFKDKGEAEEFIESYKKGILKYFSIRLNRGKVTLLRKEDEIVEEVNRMGKMIIVTNLENMDKENVPAP